MRVLQLIDSLDAGGAERMAVNCANLLSGQVEHSFLCATRKEGALRSSINSSVGYLFLKRKSRLDVTAFLKLRRYVIAQRITVIHAHSSSFFLATLIKFTLPKLKLIWHDHYGNSEQLHSRNFKTLKYCSKYFDGIIAVNETLKVWAETHLVSPRVTFLNNFYMTSPVNNETSIRLKGTKGYRIVCLANLRPQKDHLTLLKAFKKNHKKHPEATLHLLGSFNEDEYYRLIEEYIKSEQICSSVYIYGTVYQVMDVLKQADIGVLSSKSEGLPLALIEYGIAGLPVVCTNVGECKEVVGDFGLLANPQNHEEINQALSIYLTQKERRLSDAKGFGLRIRSRYEANIVLPKLIDFYYSG